MIKLTAREKRKFESNFTKGSQSNCWLWTGKSFCGGWGVMNVGKDKKYVHRISIALYMPDLYREGKNFFHVCEKKLCVNPNHIKMKTEL